MIPDTNFWNQRYAEPEAAYGDGPNEFLAQQAAGWPAGQRVLVPGDGDGRNGVWLARHGHRVVSVDQSQTAQHRLAARAEIARVSVDARIADLAQWAPPPAQFDALVLVYVHLPPGQRRTVHRRLLGALGPGGRLVLEGFDSSHFGLPGGGPRQPDWLFEAAMLREDFAGLAELRIEVCDTVLDEGRYHHGAARVIRCTGCAR